MYIHSQLSAGAVPTLSYSHNLLSYVTIHRLLMSGKKNPNSTCISFTVFLWKPPVM